MLILNLLRFKTSSKKINNLVGTVADPGFNASTTHNKTLTTGLFDNTCKADEV
jgi:hypothetical protein